MNTSNRSRNGNRNLNRNLNRPCSRPATRRLGGARQPDELLSLCRLLEEAVRLRQRLARRDPHLFGPHAQRYYLDTVRLAQEQQEIDAALHNVYGPPPSGEPQTGSTVWTDRYVFRTPEQHRLHLRWFQEHYGP